MICLDLELPVRSLIPCSHSLFNCYEIMYNLRFFFKNFLIFEKIDLDVEQHFGQNSKFYKCVFMSLMHRFSSFFGDETFLKNWILNPAVIKLNAIGSVILGNFNLMVPLLSSTCVYFIAQFVNI